MILHGQFRLISEGIISSYNDVEELWVQKDNGIVHVTSSKINPLYQNLYNKRYITSCCGKGRQGFIFANDAAKAFFRSNFYMYIM
ncbi:formate dehydrogenase accessory sulfurtransferase FdhD [Bacillus sp. D-CC]